MTYGDGDGVNLGPLVALDIAGHEMSHGVNARTANLIYSGESGGLNEANSDILGTMVEFHANNSHDTPDYLIGEEVFLSNVSGSSSQTALRYMFNPAADGRSPNCYVNTLGDLDVHYSSGVANFFYYLLAEGTGARTYSGVNHTPTTCNGSQFRGDRTRQGREDLVPRADRVLHLQHQLRRCARGHDQRRERPVRRHLGRGDCGRHRLVGGQASTEAT